jgi:tryptophan halogenase
VALGLSSGFIEPLESTSISLMHTAVDKIIAHMPELQVSSDAIDHANHLNTMEYERIRDFIIFHYRASQRDDSEFWRAVRAKPLPDLLQTKVDDFLRDGTLTQYEMESFREPSWLAMYNGFGLWPKACSPTAHALPDDQLAQVFERMKAAIQKGVAHAPLHADFLKTVYE